MYDVMMNMGLGSCSMEVVVECAAVRRAWRWRRRRACVDGGDGGDGGVHRCGRAWVMSRVVVGGGGAGAAAACGDDDG